MVKIKTNQTPLLLDNDLSKELRKQSPIGTNGLNSKKEESTPETQGWKD